MEFLFLKRTTQDMLVSVEAQNYVDDSWIQIYSVPKVQPAETVSRVFSILIEPTKYVTKCIKIYLDCTYAPSWVEIDCVALRGITPHEQPKKEQKADGGKRPDFIVTNEGNQVATLPYNPATTENEIEIFQWIVEANATSDYGQGWDATQLQGPPKVYPYYGDKSGAWAPEQSSGTKETLCVKYEFPVYVTGVFIFETFNPGHVSSIIAHNASNDASIEIYSTNQIEPAPPKARVFSITCARTEFLVKSLTINLDCTKANSWAEIDCIALRGYKPI